MLRHRTRKVVINQMNLTGIIYHNVQESFGMGGPYIGELEFKGDLINGQFLADGEKLSNDKTKLIFSRYIGSKNKGFLGLRKVREFRILVYDEPTNLFYQSKSDYEALAIEKMVENKIYFHVAFHTETKSYSRTIKFNDEDFTKIDLF